LNVIRLTSLAVQVPAWGFKALRLDSLPPEYTGRGVKVAVVDSGIATTHPALTRVNTGIDLIEPLAIDGWRNDSISHGTHCAGVIGGAPQSNVSIHGIAPEAELVAVKVFPRGHLSDLVAALDYAISQQVDVVNLSLGSDLSSEIVEQKLIEAKAHGVAVIVAAGNSGGPVQYPARSPHALAVAAIGKLNEFPANTYHAHTVLGDRRLVGREGYFSAKFSNYGDQIDVSGPGVAIISAISPTNYAVLDGTSVAASHITGLAALILAHHPDFKERYSARNAQRVERLFDILRQSARPIHVSDSRRVGAGLPDAVRALGLEGRTARGVKQQRETSAADYQVLREHLRSVGILNEGREGTSSGTNGGSASVRPTAARATGPTRNGATRAQSDQRLVTSLLLAELRKRLEDAQLAQAVEREPRRAVAEAE
jgi:subtilisin family serine protease